APSGVGWRTYRGKRTRVRDARTLRSLPGAGLQRRRAARPLLPRRRLRSGRGARLRESAAAQDRRRDHPYRRRRLSAGAAVNLRRTVFLAVALAVLATTMLEGVFDVIVDRFASERLFYDLIDIPLMLGLAAVIAWLVARRIARPLRSLTEATRRVAEQAFPTSLQIPPGNDELAELAASFNAMASAVQGYVERERAFTRYASHELRS